MAPIPSFLSKVAQDEWKNHVDTLSKTIPLAQESTSFTADIKDPNNDKVIEAKLDYRKLAINESSETFKETVTWISKTTFTDQRTSIPEAATLKYTYLEKRVGNTGDNLPLYIALHGGGKGTDSLVNDDAWLQMSTFYHGQLKEGIYIAPRGLGDLWNLHFQKTSFVLIEKLIERMILFHGADANRVYLLGFSAGGDGVYRLAARLSQRFAAANAGGGHPGGQDQFKAINLMNTPLCLQVGEQDDTADRCKAVGQAGVSLDQLLSKYASEVPPKPDNKFYVHNTFIHVNGPMKADYRPGDSNREYEWNHWEWEETNASIVTPDTALPSSMVVKDAAAWAVPTNRNAQAKITDLENTNAIAWMSSKIRDPTPPHVLWDLSTVEGDENFSDGVYANTAGRGDDGKGRTQHYWLDVNRFNSSEVGPVIEATLNNSTNTVTVLAAKKYLRILLRPGMLDLSKSVNVKVAIPGSPVVTFALNVKVDNINVIKDTLWRNDPNFVFTADVVLQQDGTGKWSATSTQ